MIYENRFTISAMQKIVFISISNEMLSHFFQKLSECFLFFARLILFSSVTISSVQCNYFIYNLIKHFRIKTKTFYLLIRNTRILQRKDEIPFSSFLFFLFCKVRLYQQRFVFLLNPRLISSEVISSAANFIPCVTLLFLLTLK